MKFVSLSAKQQKLFDEDGFLVVPNALPENTINGLTKMGDGRLKFFLDKFDVQDRPEYNHVDVRPGLLRHKISLELVTNSVVVPLVVQLLSPNIHLHSTTLIYKRPEDPTSAPFRRGWHRDIRMPMDVGQKNLPCVGVKICYCLTDFQDANSGLTLFACKSHLSEGSLNIPKGEVDPLDFAVVDLALSAGDALIFDNRIFHTAAPNLSDRVSKVLIYGYAFRWMKQEVYLNNVDASLLAKVDPITYQLLGGYRDVDTPPWALQHWARSHGILRQLLPWTVEV